MFLSRDLRSHRILTGPLAGQRICTSWHDYPGAILGTTERPLLDWFAGVVHPGESWLDVGAHYGYTAIALSRHVGPSGRVFAFEPVIQTAGCLARTRALNALSQLTVVPLALGAGKGVRAQRLQSVRGMADSTIAGTKEIETVFAISLDELWPDLCGDAEKIHGVKIDVQGMELSVLTGMRQILLRWSPKLIIEFHSGVQRSAVLDLLASCGYSTQHRAIDHSESTDALADDKSYSFSPLSARCVS